MNETNYRSCFDQLKDFPLQLTLGQQKINVIVLRIIVYWIDDMWRLQERVLDVEELGASHPGAILAEVLYSVLEEFDLTKKVSIFFNLFFIINPRCMIFSKKFFQSQLIMQAIT